MNVRALQLLPLLASPLAAQCELAQVQAGAPQTADFFGRSVALGDELLAVGATQDPFQLTQGPGQVEVFALGGASPVRLAVLQPAGGAPGDAFGQAMALSGSRVLVGAPGHDGTALEAGAAWLFELDDGGTPLDPLDDLWTVAQLTAPGLLLGDRLGTAVALAGETAFVGAPGHDQPGGGEGVVHVFERTLASWVHAGEVTPADGDPGPWSQLGVCLDADGDTLLVGATDVAGVVGAAFVFDRDPVGTPTDPLDDLWRETGVLTAPDAVAGGGFGSSCALAAGWAAVGADLDDDLGAWSGSVRLYRRDEAGTPADPFDDTWLLGQELHAVGGAGGHRFGSALAMTEDLLAVGAIGTAGFRGTAYTFARDPQGTPADRADDLWSQQLELVGSATGTAALFGGALDLVGGRLLVGAEQQGPGAVGAAYLFGVPGGLPLTADGWTLSTGLGGQQQLALDAGPCAAGGVHLVLGSLSGTTPGWPGPPHLPLNPDAYLVLTLTAPGWPVVGGLGLLDADGRGAASLGLPPGVAPGLAGLHLDHAFVVLDPVTLAATFVSNPRPLDLVP